MSRTIKAGVAALALLAVGVIGMATQEAHAQSRAVRRSAPPPAPVSPWTGFYGGFNLGYGIAGISDSLVLAGTSIMSGVFGGGQAGFNYQTGSIVLGVEADIQASGIEANYGSTFPIVGNVTVGHRIPHFGTARGRLGYAFTCGCVMAYATAGIAYGAYEPFATAGGLTVRTTYNNSAFVIGAGVEWMVAQRWSTKLEALYFDTGNLGTGVTLPLVGEINMKVRSTLTRIGLNYHF